MIKITPQQIEGKQAEAITTTAINESLVRVNFYSASGKKIASRLVLIPADQELTDENIYKNAKVEAVE